MTVRVVRQIAENLWKTHYAEASFTEKLVWGKYSFGSFALSFQSSLSWVFLLLIRMCKTNMISVD